MEPSALTKLLNLNDRQAFFTKTLADGRVIDVIPLLLARARITISTEAEKDVCCYDGW